MSSHRLSNENVCSNIFVSFHQVYGATSGDGLLESQVFVKSIQLDELTTQNQIKLGALNFKFTSNEDAEDNLEYERYSVVFSYFTKDLVLERITVFLEDFAVCLPQIYDWLSLSVSYIRLAPSHAIKRYK